MSFVHMIYLLLSVWLCRPILAQTNIFISDQSPLVSFHPEWVDSGITNKTTKEASWNITYSEVSWSGVDITSGPVGQGCSTHWTEATDASISMQFSGISLYAWGNITARGGEGNASLAYGNTTLNIDGKNVSSYDPVNGTLGMISGVSAGWHNATIYYEGSGRLYFTGFTLTLNIQDDFNTTYLATNGSSTHPINPAFNLSGSDGDDWSLQSIATQAPVQLISGSNFSTLSFDAPVNSSAIILFGNVGPAYGNFSVSSSSSPNTSNSNNPPANQTILVPMMGVSPWYGLNVVQYVHVLDPTVEYRFEITNLGPDESIYGLSSVVFLADDGYTDSDDGSGSPDYDDGPDLSLIIGLSVGLSLLLILAGLVFWLVRRRRSRQVALVKPVNFSTMELGVSSEPVTPVDCVPSLADDHSDSVPELEDFSRYRDKQAALFEDQALHNASLSAWSSPEASARPTIRTTDTSSPTSRLRSSLSNLRLGSAKTDTSASLSSRPGSSSRARAQQVSVVQEEDSGSAGPNIELLPPRYDPNWQRPESTDGHSPVEE